MTEIRKIMEKENALKVIDEIKNKLFQVDLDDICEEKIDVEEKNNKAKIFKYLIQGVMTGLVYYDDEKQCLVQKLIHPLISGDIKKEALYYKNDITLGDSKSFNAENQADLMIHSIAHITANGTQVIEQLKKNDLNIAAACTSFFDK